MVDYRTMQRAIEEAEQDWDALERFYRRSPLHPRVEFEPHDDEGRPFERRWLSIAVARTR